MSTLAWLKPVLFGVGFILVQAALLQHYVTRHLEAVKSHHLASGGSAAGQASAVRGAADGVGPPSEEGSDDASFAGRRILQLQNYFIFDYADGRKEVLQSVDSQFCNFAASRGMVVDLMMIGYWKKDIRPKNVDQVMRACLGHILLCGAGVDVEGSLECLERHMNRTGVTYDGVWTRDDERILVAEALAQHLDVSPFFDPSRAVPKEDELTTEVQTSRIVGSASFPIVNCSVESMVAADDPSRQLVFPGFIKYAQGVHATGGWGSGCLRQLSAVRNEDELARKLPFFCGKGMHSYEFLKTAAQRRMFYVPYRFGAEMAVETIVYHGKVVKTAYQSAQMSCDGKLVHVFPAHWEGFTEGYPDWGPKAQCDMLIRKAVNVLRLWNMLVGVQVFYDWRGEGSCHFVEVNLRPHDWLMLSDPGFQSQHFETVFNYGAVGVYLALDRDPRPVIHTTPPSTLQGFASVCPHSITGAGGFMSPPDLFKAWMGGTCDAVAMRPTPQAAFEAVRSHLPCANGPRFLDVGQTLKKRCTADIDAEWFWWADAKLLKRDVAALSDAPARDPPPRQEEL